MSALDDAPSPSRDSAWRRVERILDRFEEAWRSGLRPAIDDFLDGAGSLRPALLVELIRADMEFRTRAGEPARTGEYLERYPELVLQTEAMAALTRWEHQLRPSADPASMPPAGESSPSSASNLPSIPGYEVLQLIGRGGMGVVYKARQVALRRLVALKMIRGEPFSDSEERQRFLAEAHTMARAPHANIVHIHEIGEFQGQPYLVLEYVDSGTLAHRLRRQPLTVQEAAVLTAVLARAIDAAHRFGIVHRDLKPDNILLTADGTPKISDFGLAKYLDEAVTRTHNQAILGTPAYMAPEQAAGGAQPVGPAADVYGLGAILYELLTGRVPFTGMTRQRVLWKVLHDEPTPPRRLRPDLPRDLQTICLKCLEKSPQRRYRSGLELAEDLERFLTGRPLLARPGLAWERALKWARRRPAVAGLLVVTLLAFLTVVGTWVGLTLHLQHALNEREAELAAAHEVRHQEAEERQEQLRQDVRRKQYAADIRQAAQLWQLGEVSPCFNFLMYRLPPGEADDRYGFEWGYLRRWSHSRQVVLEAQLRPPGHQIHVYRVRYHPDGRRLAASLGRNQIALWDIRTGTLCGTFIGHKDRVTDFAFSPDGQTLASGGLDGTLRLWNVPDQRPVDISVARRGSIPAVEFSPDGTLLAFAQDWDTVCLWDLRAQRPRYTCRSPEDMRLSALAFAPDGRTLAASFFAGAVKLWDVRSGQETGSWLFDSAPCALAFAPHGPLLAVGLENGDVTLCDIDTRERVATLSGQGKSAGCLAFSPDGRMLLSGEGDAAIRLWDLTSRRPRAILRSGGRGIASLAFRPDGTAFAAGLVDGPVWMWELKDLPALSPSRLGNAVVPAGPVAFSPDGKRLAVAGMDGAVHLLDSENGQVQRSLPRWYGEWQDLAFAPDGRYLAAAGEDHRVHVWDASTGQRTATLLGHEDAVTCLAYSLDGKWLASGGRDHRITIWSMPAGEKRHTLRDHGGAITGLSFHPGGSLLAATSLDKTLRLWDVPGFKPRHCITHREELSGAVFTPNGRLLLANSKTGGPISWDVDGKSGLGGAKEFLTGPCRSLKAFPDSRSLAIGTARVLIYDVASRKLRCYITRPGTEDCRLAIAPDGKKMAISEREGALAIWDMAGSPASALLDWLKARQVQEWPSTPPPPIHSLVFTRDGNSLITGSKARTDTSFRTCLLGTAHDQSPVRRIGDQVQCWPLSGGPRRALLEGATLSEHPLVTLSPDGGTLAVAASDGTVSLWDLGKGKLLRRLLVSRHSRTSFPVIEKALSLGTALRLQPSRDAIPALSFSPDGRHLVTACEDGQLTLWEAASGREVTTLPGDHPRTHCLAFSSDGRLLATHSGETIELWDMSRLPERPVLWGLMPGHADAGGCLAFAPGDRLLAAGGDDWLIRLWDVDRGAEVKVLQGHIGGVIALAFSPEGKTLASGSGDGTVRLWQVATGEMLMTLTGEAQRVHAVAFSADRRYLAAGGEAANGRGAVWLWQNLPPSLAAGRKEGTGP